MRERTRERERERVKGRTGLVKMRDAARVNSTRLESSRALTFAGTSEDVPDFPSCVRPSNKIAPPWRKEETGRVTAEKGEGRNRNALTGGEWEG